MGPVWPVTRGHFLNTNDPSETCDIWIDWNRTVVGKFMLWKCHLNMAGSDHRDTEPCQCSQRHHPGSCQSYMHQWSGSGHNACLHAIKHQQPQTNMISFWPPWQTLALLRWTTQRWLWIDMHAQDTYVTMLIFCAHHTDNTLCRVTVPPSNNHVLSILKLISRCWPSNIYKIHVHCPGFTKCREGWLAFLIRMVNSLAVVSCLNVLWSLTLSGQSESTDSKPMPFFSWSFITMSTY